MQDRPEYLALEPRDAVDLDRERREIVAAREPAGSRARWCQGAARDDRARVRLERRQRVLVDDGADVGGEQRGVADRERVHDAREQLQHARRDVLLHEQHAQRRAALAGGVEGGSHRVVHDLFGQRRTVDEHRVLPAGLGDQRGERAVVGRQRAIDELRGLGRAGEGDARDARIARQHRPDLRAAPRNEVQHVAGDAARVQQPHHLRGDQPASARPASRSRRCPRRAPRRPGR